MSALVRRHLAGLLIDLASTSGMPAPRLEDRPWQHWPGAESLHAWFDDGSGVGLWVDTVLPEVDQVVSVVDQLHEAVLENLPRHHLPTNWPACPDHPDTHPLEVAAVDERVAWRCPTSRRAIADVGRL